MPLKILIKKVHPFSKVVASYHHLGAKSMVVAQEVDEKAGVFLHQYKGILCAGVVVLASIALIDPSYAVKVDSLKVPIADLKKEMFDGWMWIAKIGACVAGVGFTIFKQTLTPFAMGGAIGAGIHFMTNGLATLPGLWCKGNLDHVI